MSVESSSYEVGAVQACGRVDVKETHADHLGNVYYRFYRIAPGADYAAILAAHAAEIETQLAEAEFGEVIA